MALLPGTPIPTQGISPFVRIMQQGIDGIGQGARLASARISQNQQGVGAFLKDSLRQQLAAQQAQQQERQFQISTGVKLEGMRIQQENAEADRALRAQQMSQSAALARQREGRLQRAADQQFKLNQEKAERDALLRESIGSFFSDAAGTVESPTPAVAAAAEPINPPLLPASAPDNESALMAQALQDPSVGEPEQTMNFPERQEVLNGNVPQPDINTVYGKRITDLAKLGKVFAMSGNTSAALGFANQISQLTFEQNKLAVAAAEDVRLTAQTLKSIDRNYNQLDYLGLSDDATELETFNKLMNTSTPVRLTEGPVGELLLATGEGNRTSLETLTNTSSLMEQKVNSLQVQKARAYAEVRRRDGVDGTIIVDEWFDPKIKSATSRYERVVNAQLQKMSDERILTEKSPQELRNDLNATDGIIKAFEAELNAIGSRGIASGDNPPGRKFGELGHLEDAQLYLREWRDGISKKENPGGRAAVTKELNKVLDKIREKDTEARGLHEKIETYKNRAKDILTMQEGRLKNKTVKPFGPDDFEKAGTGGPGAKAPRRTDQPPPRLTDDELKIKFLQGLK